MTISPQLQGFLLSLLWRLVAGGSFGWEDLAELLEAIAREVRAASNPSRPMPLQPQGTKPKKRRRRRGRHDRGRLRATPVVMVPATNFPPSPGGDRPKPDTTRGC